MRKSTQAVAIGLLSALVALPLAPNADAKKRLTAAPDATAEARIPPVAVEAREDARFAEYVYNGNQVFDIAVSTSSHLHILLDEGEEVRHFMARDKRYWRWEADVETKRSIYVSADPGAQATTATLRTTHGIYEMTLRPASSGVVYRQVRFRHPDVAKQAELNARLAAERQEAERVKRDAEEVPTGTAVDKLNFRYEVHGKADFAPRRVFDDGQLTYVVLGSSPDMPALFETGADGSAKSVAYTHKNGTLIVRRVMREFALVLDKQVVKVYAEGARAGFRWPWQ